MSAVVRAACRGDSPDPGSDRRTGRRVPGATPRLRATLPCALPAPSRARPFDGPGPGAIGAALVREASTPPDPARVDWRARPAAVGPAGRPLQGGQPAADPPDAPTERPQLGAHSSPAVHAALVGRLGGPQTAEARCLARGPGGLPASEMARVGAGDRLETGTRLAPDSSPGAAAAPDGSRPAHPRGPCPRGALRRASAARAAACVPPWGARPSPVQRVAGASPIRARLSEMPSRHGRPAQRVPLVPPSAPRRSPTPPRDGAGA